MKHWFITMWPDCKDFLKLMGIIYGLIWMMLMAVGTLSGFPFFSVCWATALILLGPAGISMLCFLASTVP